jgi:RimJ/RimL family protein N-acetyltransferase/GNAT superfamily N-acetyltransferase
MGKYRVVTITNLLEHQVDKIVQESKEEGFRFVERLLNDYREGTNCFNIQGEALYGIYDVENELVAVGGLNVDPSSAETGRVRRFYVKKEYRNEGVGTLLLKRIILDARRSFNVLILHTDTEKADHFYTSFGFTKGDRYPNATHYLDISERRKPFRIDCGDIYLQEFSIEDANHIHRISNQPEISCFLPDWKSTGEQRVEWLTHYEIPANKAFLEAADKTGNVADLFLKMGVFRKGTEELIGWCCSGIKEELPAPNREIMYAISSEHQGNGYATKASIGLIEYLFTHTNVDLLNAVALKYNDSSIKVIEKCGFTYQGQIKIDEEPYLHYRLDKSDYERSAQR